MKLSWWFYKDGSANSHEDSGFVDNIVITDSNGAVMFSEDFSIQATTTQPSYVTMPIGSKVIEEVSAGTRHTCAVDSARQVLCWGYNGGSATMTLGGGTLLGNSTTPHVTLQLPDRSFRRHPASGPYRPAATSPVESTLGSPPCVGARA